MLILIFLLFNLPPSSKESVSSHLLSFPPSPVSVIVEPCSCWTAFISYHGYQSRIIMLCMMIHTPGRPASYSPANARVITLMMFDDVDFWQVDCCFASIFIFVCHIYLQGYLGRVCVFFFFSNIIPNVQISVVGRRHPRSLRPTLTLRQNRASLETSVPCCPVTSVRPLLCGKGTGRVDADDHTRRGCQLDPVT